MAGCELIEEWLRWCEANPRSDKPASVGELSDAILAQIRTGEPNIAHLELRDIERRLEAKYGADWKIVTCDAYMARFGGAA